MTNTDMAKITFNLVVIYVIGGLIMAFVYAKTSPIMCIKAKEVGLSNSSRRRRGYIGYLRRFIILFLEIL